MPTQHQPWLRAELIAAPETMPGAQLMIPADGVEFHDDELVFHYQGDIVYVAAKDQLRSITWFAKQPNPETARRRAQWPKHGTRWTDEERADLLRRIRAGESWKAISLAHARSRTGCQQEAVKQGWVQPETFRPTPELLLGIAEMEAGKDSAPGAESAAPPSATTQPAESAPANEPALTAALSAPPPAAESVAWPSTAAPPTVSSSATESAFGGTKSDAPHTEASARPSIAAPPTESSSPTGSAFTATRSAPSPYAPAPESIPRAESAAPPAPTSSSAPASSPVPAISPAPASVAADIAVPNPDRPDRPQLPPRVPRQRTDSDAPPAPEPEDEGDSEKASDPGPSSGSRLFSRAQSSLARAALGAYMNPSRSQSGTTPGST